MPTEQVIYPYEAPRRLADNLWQVQGSLPMGIPRNMTVYRLDDGRLLLYSVIAMHDEGMRALEALGAPAIMVMPVFLPLARSSVRGRIGGYLALELGNLHWPTQVSDDGEMMFVEDAAGHPLPVAPPGR